MSRTKKLPDHYLRDRMRFRRAVDAFPGLSRGCRDYAKWLAFQRWGAGLVASSRAKAARALGCSERSIQRYRSELVTAGLLAVEQEGGIWAGRRFIKVFRMLFPQVRQGDRLSPLRSKTTSYRTRRATRGQQLALDITPEPPTRAVPPPTLTAAFPHIGQLLQHHHQATPHPAATRAPHYS